MMTDSSTSCPSPVQLQALVDSTLAEDQQPDVQAHVDGCDACQQLLKSLVEGSESWDAALANLKNATPSEESLLSDAIRRMKANNFVEATRPKSNAINPVDFLTPSDQPGSIGRLGSYEVTEVIGQGGMGVVLKAFDPTLHRVVAVKVLAPYLAHNPQARKRFVREAQAIAAVSHDHVITIHAIDESAEQPKIVMQFISGPSLQQKIDAEGSLDLREILRIGMQTASGLAAAHAQGLVHRDVKPSNILLENGIQRVKLTDFGLARAADDASLTQSGVIAGTPQYMAPEQANGDAVDRRADLFSLGSVIYAMCVGHSPFRASTTMGVLKRVCLDSPRPIQELNPDIPDWLCVIVMKLLAKKPADRFPDARSVAELLEKWLAHIQQPTVVAKPSLVESDSTLPDPLMASKEERMPSDQGVAVPARFMNYDDPARTIFFQSVSGRWMLFFFLTAMAITIAFGIYSNRGPGELGSKNSLELVVVGILGGLIGGIWGMVFVAVARFLWANIQRSFFKRSNADHAEDTKDASEVVATDQNRSLIHTAPESIAMLAGIVVMLFAGNPLVAAIVAIIVWRVATSSTKPIAPLHTTNSVNDPGRH